MKSKLLVIALLFSLNIIAGGQPPERSMMNSGCETTVLKFLTSNHVTNHIRYPGVEIARALRVFTDFKGTQEEQARRLCTGPLRKFPRHRPLGVQEVREARSNTVGVAQQAYVQKCVMAFGDPENEQGGFECRQLFEYFTRAAKTTPRK